MKTSPESAARTAALRPVLRARGTARGYQEKVKTLARLQGRSTARRRIDLPGRDGPRLAVRDRPEDDPIPRHERRASSVGRERRRSRVLRENARRLVLGKILDVERVPP